MSFALFCAYFSGLSQPGAENAKTAAKRTKECRVTVLPLSLMIHLLFPHMWGGPHWGVCALLYAKNFRVRRRFHIDLIDLIIIIPTEIAIVISWGGLFIRSRNGEAFDSRPLISFKSINNWSAVRFFAPHLGGGPTGKKFARKKC